MNEALPLLAAAFVTGLADITTEWESSIQNWPFSKYTESCPSGGMELISMR